MIQSDDWPYAPAAAFRRWQELDATDATGMPFTTRASLLAIGVTIDHKQLAIDT